MLADLDKHPGLINAATDATGSYLHLQVGWPTTSDPVPAAALRIDNISFTTAGVAGARADGDQPRLRQHRVACRSTTSTSSSGRANERLRHAPARHAPAPLACALALAASARLRREEAAGRRASCARVSAKGIAIAVNLQLNTARSPAPRRPAASPPGFNVDGTTTYAIVQNFGGGLQHVRRSRSTRRPSRTAPATSPSACPATCNAQDFGVHAHRRADRRQRAARRAASAR